MWGYIFVTEDESVIEKLSAFVKLLEVGGKENIEEVKPFRKISQKKYNADYETNRDIVLITYLSLVVKECGVNEPAIKANNKSPKPTEARYIFSYLINEQFFFWKRDVIANFLNKHPSIVNTADKYIKERTTGKFAHISENMSLIQKIENIKQEASLSTNLQKVIKTMKEYDDKR